VRRNLRKLVKVGIHDRQEACICLFVLVGLAIIGSSLFGPTLRELPYGFTKPMLALEMTRTSMDVDDVRQKYPGGASSIFWSIVVDFILVIPAYTALFIAFSRHKSVPFPYRTLLRLVAVVAAGTDCGENTLILIKSPSFMFSIVKWVSLGIQLGLMACVLAKAGRMGMLLAAFCLASTACLIAAVSLPRLIEPGFLVMGIALLLCGATLPRGYFHAKVPSSPARRRVR
jgi:hypothetical protein